MKSLLDSLIFLCDASAGGDAVRNPWQVAQIWVVSSASFVLMILVVWQLLAESRRRRRQRKSDAAQVDSAKAEAERLVAAAQEQCRQLKDSAQEQCRQLKANAQQEADVILKDAEVKAKEAVINAKAAFDESVASHRRELERMEERLTQKEENVDRKQQQLDQRMATFENREEQQRAAALRLQEREAQVEVALQSQQAELLRISGLTVQEARQEVLQTLENSMVSERGQLIRRFQEENASQMEAMGQKIMLDAMQRYAGECAYERTTATIPLPNDEMKGRIIGREGRNIRTIELATGASLLVDDTPQAVVVSCFDPVRKEVARRTLEKLVSDGRIHPGRVEDVVEKTKREVETEVQKAGQETVDKLNILHLKPNVVSLLGRLKFRFSYSQNVLAHSIEVASLAGSIAAGMGLDEGKARRAGLLHDIGKAVDHEVEGSHAIIGADLLRRAGEDEEVINAVAAHHEEVEKTSLLAALVQVCDTLSAGRPGARCETTELYIKRLDDLEKIGNSFDGVESCFAIQAGRELRVIVKPEKVSEEQAAILARSMAERIEKEMRYPGQIRVSIIRETRAVEYAK